MREIRFPVVYKSPERGVWHVGFGLAEIAELHADDAPVVVSQYVSDRRLVFDRHYRWREGRMWMPSQSAVPPFGIQRPEHIETDGFLDTLDRLYWTLEALKGPFVDDLGQMSYNARYADALEGVDDTEMSSDLVASQKWGDVCKRIPRIMLVDGNFHRVGRGPTIQVTPWGWGHPPAAEVTPYRIEDQVNLLSFSCMQTKELAAIFENRSLDTTRYEIVYEPEFDQVTSSMIEDPLAQAVEQVAWYNWRRIRRTPMGIVDIPAIEAFSDFRQAMIALRPEMEGKLASIGQEDILAISEKPAPDDKRLALLPMLRRLNDSGFEMWPYPMVGMHPEQLEIAERRIAYRKYVAQTAIAP